MTPDNAVLAVNDSIQVTVEFNPKTIGEHNQDLVIHYETGDQTELLMPGKSLVLV